jgi:hypothetical protein
MKTYTIKQWFKRVADPKLREELLANMVNENMVCESFKKAIYNGIKNGTGIFEHYKMLEINNQIELLPLKPKIKKSDLLKRIEELEEIVKSLSQPIQIDPFFIDPFGKTTIYNENEQTNVVGNCSDLPEKKIVFDWFISGEGKLITPRVSAIQYKNAKEIAQIGYNKYIFKSYDNDPLVYIIYIGHYE